jgi:hypothetical protein
MGVDITDGRRPPRMARAGRHSEVPPTTNGIEERYRIHTALSRVLVDPPTRSPRQGPARECVPASIPAALGVRR